jgi:xylulokinase
MSKLLLGIDIGTYSSKGVLVEKEGTVAKTAGVDHEISIPHPVGPNRMQTPFGGGMW